MVQKITAPKITTITKDGECRLVIELTININSSGQVTVSSKEEKEEKDVKIDFAIPSFATGLSLPNFGK